TLRPWFLSIVANECRMTRRRRWWSVLRMAEVPPESGAIDQPSGAMSPDLHRAILQLDPADRVPLVLHFYLDLPLEEVARTLGVSTSAAKSRIYRAARRLRSGLTLEEVF
ncbi:MAG: RNA polymerase sigma factor, partial [Candidatus Dormibacteraceae bacterium]